MPNPYRNNTQAQEKYDPRWFIWTIVFLLVVGISLTSYIMFSDDGTGDYFDVPKRITKSQ